MRPLLLKTQKVPESPSGLAPDQSVDLLKILSHDLRGSLVSMSALLQILHRGYQQKVDHLVETKLAELIEKMGSLSSMLEESLRMVLSLEEGDLRDQLSLDLSRDVIEPVMYEFAPEIRDRQLTIQNRSDPVMGFPVHAKINDTVLKMIFRNLLSNAIKYADVGGIIALNLKQSGPFCLLKIYNSGMPIPERIVERFSSSTHPLVSQNERNPHGMGLGLRLAKRIMQTQGGEIWCEPGEEGTTFVLAIPIETQGNRQTGCSQGTLFS
jgi:signal transduction histidine kinase